MEDYEIVRLYWQREERAIEETAMKYSAYCYAIAHRILGSPEDAEESVNDTWQGAWSSIPPHEPSVLSTYLGKLTRRISLKRWRGRDAQKRGGGEVPLSLEELMECIPDKRRIDENLEQQELTRILNKFLETLPVEERRVFIRRYWHFCSIAQLCEQFGYSKSKVESMLYRTRKKLRVVLQTEGVLV